MHLFQYNYTAHRIGTPGSKITGDGKTDNLPLEAAEQKMWVDQERMMVERLYRVLGNRGACENTGTENITKRGN
jgi:hypothetical protein